MKITLMSFFDHKKYLLSVVLVLCTVIFIVKPAYSQIDYNYGLNKKGLRFSLGLGGNTLQTTWNKTPVGYTLVGGLSYDLSNYFSIVVEGQYGSMTGVDGSNSFVYSKSVNSYSSESASLRFSIGLLGDFYSSNGFTDAVKRSYISVGYGAINSNVVLTPTTVKSPVNYYELQKDGSGNRIGTVPMIPFSVGTNIAMPGVWGSDVLELNPNIQYTLFKEALVDGYQPTTTSTAGGYVLISVSLRYKF